MALARGGRISVGALGQPIGYKVDPVLMKRVVDEYERGVGKRVAVPRDEWIEIRGHSPELVSEALFDAVNERLGKLMGSVGEVAGGVR